jgi:hypothetical protein
VAAVEVAVVAAEVAAVAAAEVAVEAVEAVAAVPVLVWASAPPSSNKQDRRKSMRPSLPRSLLRSLHCDAFR